jgi:hypothetical protein
MSLRIKEDDRSTTGSCNQGKTMAKISLNSPAPDFSLTAFDGSEVKLSDFSSEKNALLVFNRGFT